MALVLDGTNGVSGVDGTASNPAIEGTDSNTGVFFPAADTVAIGTGGTEHMRITAGGNVGIGTSSPENKLTVAGDVRINANAGSVSHIFNFNENGGEISLYNNTGASGTLIDLASGTTRALHVLSTGNLQVGLGAANTTGVIQFVRAGYAEAMRITSGGEVYIAGTTDQGAYNLQCNGTGVWGAGSYINGSDERIKEDIAPIASGLDVVTKLNPVTYRYKEDWSKDQSTQTGFIAQELLVAMEGKNYVDGVVQQGGSEGYYSVAYQNIIPLLTKAIQELNAKVEALEAQLKGNA